MSFTTPRPLILNLKLVSTAFGGLGLKVRGLDTGWGLERLVVYNPSKGFPVSDLR